MPRMLFPGKIATVLLSAVLLAFAGSPVSADKGGRPGWARHGRPYYVVPPPGFYYPPPKRYYAPGFYYPPPRYAYPPPPPGYFYPPPPPLVLVPPPAPPGFNLIIPFP